MNASDKMFYVNVMKSEKCQCENPKKRRYALCFNCWKKLPEYMQKALYRRLGFGFEKAYDKAVRCLNEDS